MVVTIPTIAKTTSTSTSVNPFLLSIECLMCFIGSFPFLDLWISDVKTQLTDLGDC